MPYYQSMETNTNNRNTKGTNMSTLTGSQLDTLKSITCRAFGYDDANVCGVTSDAICTLMDRGLVRATEAPTQGRLGRVLLFATPIGRAIAL